ncbi:hypothetical protein [Salipiger sp.]|uniref:hypothetical protein n=1 Tax=Salipiger sp. TaxID=2078585 RepID=UPI003A97F45A
MDIQFNTFLYETDLVVEVIGDTVILNGEVFDFSALPVGATLPREAINSIWFGDDVHRDDAGKLHLTLFRPYGWRAADERREPVLMADLPDGVIKFPPFGEATPFPEPEPMPDPELEPEPDPVPDPDAGLEPLAAPEEENT